MNEMEIKISVQIWNELQVMQKNGLFNALKQEDRLLISWVCVNDMIKEIETYMSCYKDNQDVVDVCLALIKQLKQSKYYGKMKES